jgi:SAM-dependent methyltransferase
MNNWNNFWNKENIFGIPKFKINFFLKKYLYLIFKIKLPKLKSQEKYWSERGKVYREEFLTSNYHEYEIFFQNMLVNELKKIQFNSICELGCGFGWNLKRIKDEFPDKNVEGVDFSSTQIENSKIYLKKYNLKIHHNSILDLNKINDDQFDCTFALGNYQNIHKNFIDKAIDETLRVTKKYIIHIDSDENYYSEDLKKNRVFKQNINSHDYKKLYLNRNCQIIKFLTYKDFELEHNQFIKKVKKNILRWEKWESASKYIFLVVKKNIQNI